MSKNRKPRKQYRPRAVGGEISMGPIGRAMQASANRQPMTDDQARDLGIAYHLALERMLRGAGDEEAWSAVTCSLNIALVLCERDIGKEYEPMLVRALDGAFRAKVRAGRTARWAYDGDAITDIRDAFLLHDEQLKIATLGEVRAALQEVRRRIDAGNVYQEAA